MNLDPRPKICHGNVIHRRLHPAVNAFTYPVFYVLLPLRELARAECAAFSVDRPNLLSFYTRDHGPRDGSPLLPWIEQRLSEQGLPHDGSIVLQTFPRVLGYVFNPVSFWYCHDRAGRLIAILAEVNNTFGGTHAYLLHQQGAALPDGVELHADKQFHVSPFNRVEGSYRFRFRLGHERHHVAIDYDEGAGHTQFTAITGRPQRWSTRALLAAFARMPLLTLGVTARIHWQALKLWRKGVPFHGAHSHTRPLPESIL